MTLRQLRNEFSVAGSPVCQKAAANGTAKPNCPYCDFSRMNASGEVASQSIVAISSPYVRKPY